MSNDFRAPEQLKVFETTLRDMSRAANPNKPKKTQIEIEAGNAVFSLSYGRRSERSHVQG